MMKRFLTAFFLILMPVLHTFAIPQKPATERLVNDFADILTDQQERMLEKMLVAFDDSTSNQIVVVTVNDIEGYSASMYANEIGQSWRVGDQRFDNGVVLLVKPKTQTSKGETAIAVGYGLEGAIPDVYAKRIITNYLIPAFKENDYYRGIHSACVKLMQLASGEISEIREKNEGTDGFIIIKLLLIVGFIAFLFFLIYKGGNSDSNGGGGGYRDISDDISSAIIIGSILRNSQRRSAGWGSTGGRDLGGGFGGGFGGGSFGGFGGGSFGGGGASGSW